MLLTNLRRSNYTGCRFAPLREAIPETPVRVEYTLTKKGRALGKAIGVITD
jgi:hypothetical protein